MTKKKKPYSYEALSDAVQDSVQNWLDARMHEWENHGNISRMKIPGGWLYSTSAHDGRGTVNTTYVPVFRLQVRRTVITQDGPIGDSGDDPAAQ